MAAKKSEPRRIDTSKRPAKGDREDKRCAFVERGDGKDEHSLGADPNETWCYGCEFHICQACSKNLMISKGHDVTDHLIDSEALDFEG